jgi:Na+/H+ antiporter NhaC
LNKLLKFGLTALIFIAICAVAAGRPAGPDLVWYSIVPPLLAVTLAIATNRLLLSLAAAVVTGIVLAAGRNHAFSINALLVESWEVVKTTADGFNLQVIIFIVFMLSAISVVIASGGLQGVINWLSRFAKGRRSTQLITALMGLAIFIDDYANTMIVGSAMRPATDQQKISREKLAFLVDATSAPIAGLAVVSTWIGYEVGLFSDAAASLGISKDGYSMFFDALAFRFYCVMMVIFMFANALSGQDFGPMRRAEERARKTGAVLAADATPLTSRAFAILQPAPSAKLHPLAAVIPIGVLFGLMLAGFWIDGGGKGSILSLQSWRDALANADNVKILAIASGTALVAAVACAKLISRIRLVDIGNAVVSGLKGSLLPTAILVLAWSLKAVCDSLATGGFLAATVSDVLSPVWFPSLLFIVACFTSFATGTSWGAMAILIPTAIPIAFALDGNGYGLTTIICLGAVLDGSIFGDHCSPISDTTIMSSISSSCDALHHVRTQLPYSLTVAGLALVCGYIPATLGVSSLAGIGVAAALIVALFYALSKIPGGK